MNLHSDAVLTNVIVKLTNRKSEDCTVHKLFVKRYY